jgi:exonuclease III
VYTITLAVTDTDTVAVIHTALEQRTGLTPTEQLLTLNGVKPLTAGIQLVHYGITKGDTVCLREADSLIGGASEAAVVEEVDLTIWGEPMVQKLGKASELLEQDWLGLDPDWTAIQEGQFPRWFRENYDAAEYWSTCISRKMGALRTIAVGSRRDGVTQAVLRYFTLTHVWAIRFTPGQEAEWFIEDEVETPPEAADMVALLVPLDTPTLKQLGVRLNLVSLLIGGSGSRVKLGVIKQGADEEGCTASYSGTCTTGPTGQCPLCNGTHPAHWRSRRFDGCVRTKCEGGETRSNRMSSSLEHTLYGNRRPVQDTTREQQDGDKEKNNGHRRKSKTWTANDNKTTELKRHDLRIIQWNTDGRTKTEYTMQTLLIFLVEHMADIVCLQEVEGTPLDKWAIAQAGYNTYMHGQVAILISIETAEALHEPALMWKSESFNSMTATFLVPGGSFVAASAYLPTGLDKTKGWTTEERIGATDQHLELSQRSNEHDYGILMMDANETTTPAGRVVQIQTQAGLKVTPSAASKGNTLLTSSMACYTRNMVDADVSCNPGAYTIHGDPREAAYTHQQPLGADKHINTNKLPLSKAKLDFTWMSKNLRSTVPTMKIMKDPATWREGAKRDNYHCITMITFPWPGIWEKLRQPRPRASANSTPVKLNMHLLTPETEATIAMKVEDHLYQIRTSTKKIRLDPHTSDEYKARILNETLHTAIMQMSQKVLGKRKPDTRGGTAQTNARDHLAVWDRVHEYVGAWLHRNRQRRAHPEPLDDVTADEMRRLNKHGANIPEGYDERRKWWTNRTHNRTHVAELGKGCLMTDEKALKNRKQFVQQLLKPHSSTTISSLMEKGRHLTTEEEIEDGLHDFLKGIAGSPEQRPDQDWGSYKHAEKLDKVMQESTPNEVRKLLSGLDANSAAGELPAALLKAVTTNTYQETVKKTVKEMKRERRYAETGNMHQPAGRDPRGAPTRRTIHINQDKQVTRHPDRALKLLTHVINLSLKAGSVPESEKRTVVTGLPKGEGQVHSTANLRPISVGPVIGKLINKMIAERLGAALIQHNMLDPAQFAFLPGRSMHEAINSVIACFRQSNNAENNTNTKPCYAVFYDISKAYDCVKWSSIERALKRVGAPKILIDFVIQSLQGTTLEMKTGRPGGMTKPVQIHKAIKQGCPLAPLLFVILMDELHAGYRKIGGYQMVGGEIVSSRGYCDDTAIVASDLPTLRKMNEWTYVFFETHGLKLNTIKSIIMGVHRDGSRLRTSLSWPESRINLTLARAGDTVRYLGIYLNMELDWQKQIGKMNAQVMTMVAAVRHGRITALQTGLLVREVLGAKLEIGLRHAVIPKVTLAGWDTWITSALCKRLELGHARLHKSMVYTVLGALSIEDTATAVRTSQMMESVSGGHELQGHYRMELDTANQGTMMPGHPVMQTVRTLAGQGLCIVRNESRVHMDTNLSGRQRSGNQCWQVDYIAAYKHTGRKAGGTWYLTYWSGHRIPTWTTKKELDEAARDTREAYDEHIQNGTAQRCGDLTDEQIAARPYARPEYGPTDVTTHPPYMRGPALRCSGVLVPTRTDGTYGMWGYDFRPPLSGLEVHGCTDGSTFPGKPSGAAYVFVDDDVREHEYDPKGEMWQIEESNNFEAELAGINKILRALPVTVDIHIGTDSDASIKAIASALVKYGAGCPNLAGQAARPYITAICEAILKRLDAGSNTRFSHVFSHTGLRDATSLGNAMADRRAKMGALQEGGASKHDIDKMTYEMAYVLTLAPESNNEEEEGKEALKVAHGNIRRAVRDRLKEQQVAQWGKRKDRGATISRAAKPVLAFIRAAWTKPTTEKLGFVLGALTQAMDVLHGYENKSCDRCSQTVPKREQTMHAVLCCPAVADLWNSMDEWAAKMLRIRVWSMTQTNPTESIISKLQRGCVRETGTGKIKMPGLGQDVCVTAEVFRHVSRLMLEAKAKEVTRDCMEYVKRAEAALTYTRNAAKVAGGIAEETVNTVDAIMDHLAPRHEIMTGLKAVDLKVGQYMAVLAPETGDSVGTGTEIWMGMIQEQRKQSILVKWMDVSPPLEGSPTAAGRWCTDADGVTPLKSLPTLYFLSVSVPWEWNGDEAALPQQYWQMLHARAVLAPIRMNWDNTMESTGSTKEKARPPPKPNPGQPSITAFLLGGAAAQGPRPKPKKRKRDDETRPQLSIAPFFAPMDQTPDPSNTENKREELMPPQVISETREHARPDQDVQPYDAPIRYRCPIRTANDLPKAMRSVLLSLRYREGKPIQYPSYWQAPALKAIIAGHLRTMREMRVHSAAAHPGMEWHSNVPAAQALGAIGGSEVVFMRNNLTWINMTDEPNDLSTQAIEAVRTATRPTRVVMLTRVHSDHQPEPGVRIHTLAIFADTAVDVTHATLGPLPLTRERTGLRVVIMETLDAPVANYIQLQQDLEQYKGTAAVKVLFPPWAPQTTHNKGTMPKLTARYPRHKQAALSWYRPEPYWDGTKLHKDTPTGCILTSIGASGATLRATLCRNGILPESITPEVMAAIKEKLRETAFKAYTRQARWSQADRYGLRGTMHDRSW